MENLPVELIDLIHKYMKDSDTICIKYKNKYIYKLFLNNIKMYKSYSTKLLAWYDFEAADVCYVYHEIPYSFCQNSYNNEFNKREFNTINEFIKHYMTNYYIEI